MNLFTLAGKLSVREHTLSNLRSGSPSTKFLIRAHKKKSISSVEGITEKKCVKLHYPGSRIGSDLREKAWISHSGQLLQRSPLVFRGRSPRRVVQRMNPFLKRHIGASVTFVISLFLYDKIPPRPIMIMLRGYFEAAIIASSFSGLFSTSLVISNKVWCYTSIMRTNNTYCWDTYRISFFSYLNSFLDDRHKQRWCSCCWFKLIIVRYHLILMKKMRNYFCKPTSSSLVHSLSQVKGKTYLLAKQLIWLVAEKSLIVGASILIARWYIWAVKHWQAEQQLD